MWLREVGRIAESASIREFLRSNLSGIVLVFVCREQESLPLRKRGRAMRLTNIANILSIAALAVFLHSGCYTQLATVRSEVVYEEETRFYPNEQLEEDEEYVTEEDSVDEVYDSRDYYEYADQDQSPRYHLYFRYYHPSSYYWSAYHDPYFDPYYDCYSYYDPWICGTPFVFYPWPGYYPWYYRHSFYFGYRYAYYDPGYYYGYPGYGYSQRFFGHGGRHRTNRDFGSTRGGRRSRDGSHRGGGFSVGDTFDPPPAMRSLPPGRRTNPRARVDSDRDSRERVRRHATADSEKDKTVRKRTRTRDTKRKESVRRKAGSSRRGVAPPPSKGKDSKSVRGKRQADSRKRGGYRKSGSPKGGRSKSGYATGRSRSSKGYSTTKGGSSRSKSVRRGSSGRHSRSSRPSVARSGSRGSRGSATRGSARSSGGRGKSGGSRRSR